MTEESHPPTIKALELKIQELEKKLAAGDGSKALEDRIAKLEKQLAAAREADDETDTPEPKEEPPKKGGGLFWW